jgi:hypothetical protein
MKRETENPCVGGSIPPLATSKINNPYLSVTKKSFAPVTKV